MTDKWVTREEARERIKKYCAYQERCHFEVELKLKELKIPLDWRDELLLELLEEDFLNEQRFAIEYTRSKINQKKWGRFKIRQNLKSKRISDKCIETAFGAIDNETYVDNLDYWLSRKLKDYNGSNRYETTQKVIRFCLTKGYSYEEINSALSKMGN